MGREGWIVAVAIACTACGRTAPCEGEPVAAHWVKEVVDHVVRKGDLAVDGSGVPHLLYQGRGDEDDGLSHDIRYASKMGAWRIEVLSEVVSDEDQPVTLAIDRADVAHLAWPAAELPEIASHYRREAGEWVAEPIDGMGGAVEMAVDASGAVHLVSAFLRYATNRSGRWTVEDVNEVNEGDVQVGASLALDRLGGPVLAYHLGWGPHRALRLSRLTEHGWSHEVVGPIVYGNSYRAVCCSTATVFDTAGALHVFSSGIALVHASNESGSWQMETLPVEGRVGARTVSAVLDPSGALHVAWSDLGPDRGNDKTRVLHHATGSTGSWSIEDVDEFPPLNGFTSMAVDAADRLFVAYVGADHQLMLAMREPGTASGCDDDVP